MTGALSEDEILADVARMLADFQGREYLRIIARSTRFFADLGLASIDAVVLGEMLQEHYQRPPALRRADGRELGRREDRDLSIGELIAFLFKNLRTVPVHRSAEETSSHAQAQGQRSDFSHPAGG